jgi:hypothetical protein
MSEKSFQQFMSEAASKSLSRIHQHVQGRNVGMITANRGENTEQENKQRNKELEHHIRKAGYGFVKVKGRYIENHGTEHARAVDEHSYLVIGKKGNDNGHLKGFLKKHGEKYGQDSVLHKAHDEEHANLHGTREGGFPGKGKTHNMGTFHPNKAGEYHTKMKGKRSFTFEEVESVQFVTTPTFFSREENLF